MMTASPVCGMSLRQSALEVQLVSFHLQLISVVKFRPKKSKVDQLSEIHHLDDLSEDEYDQPDQLGSFGPEPLLPSRKRTKLLKGTRDVLRVHLHHGDILIQQGANLQKYYEVYPWS
jgi:hypothetical protein